MTVTRQPRTGPGEPLFSFQAGSSDLATTLTTNAWRLKHWRAIRMETNTPSLSCIGSMMLTLERRSSKAGSFLGSGLGQQREKRAPSHSWARELHCDGQVVQSLLIQLVIDHGDEDRLSQTTLT